MFFRFGLLSVLGFFVFVGVMTFYDFEGDEMADIDYEDVLNRDDPNDKQNLKFALTKVLDKKEGRTVAQVTKAAPPKSKQLSAEEAKNLRRARGLASMDNPEDRKSFAAAVSMKREENPYFAEDAEQLDIPQGSFSVSKVLAAVPDQDYDTSLGEKAYSINGYTFYKSVNPIEPSMAGPNEPMKVTINKHNNSLGVITGLYIVQFLPPSEEQEEEISVDDLVSQMVDQFDLTLESSSPNILTYYLRSNAVVNYQELLGQLKGYPRIKRVELEIFQSKPQHR